MKKFFCLITACASILATTMTVEAQNTKWGKPQQDEWNMTVYEDMPDAEAVVLCKTVKVEYELRGGFEQFSNVPTELNADNYHTVGINRAIEEDLTALVYDVKLRIKILKDSGTKYGNVDIVYFNSEKELEWYDDFHSFGVVRFEQVNGKVKKHRIGQECYSEERLDGNYMVRHVTVPALKAGDIVEYQYKLFSRRSTFLYDWQLQETAIPVAYSCSHMEIPVFLSFNMQAPIHPNVKSKVVEGSMALPQQTGSMQAPKRCKTNCYTIEARNIMPQSYFAAEGSAENPAQVSGKGTLIELRTAHNIPQVKQPVAMPKGKHHIMIGAEK